MDSSEEARRKDSAESGIGNGSSGSVDRCVVGGRGGGGTAKVEEDGCVQSSTANALREAYNGCLSALGDFR